MHLPITNKTKPSSYQYSLFGHPLSKVASHAYLGVKLDSKLSWAKHITEITTKSSKVLGMVKRTLGPCKPKVKDTAYNMLVRPKLEYASPVWNPHTSSQINRLERIQHYAARLVANDHRRTINQPNYHPSKHYLTGPQSAQLIFSGNNELGLLWVTVA